MGGGLESSCVGRVCGANSAVRYGTIRTVHTTYAAYVMELSFFLKGVLIIYVRIS